MVVCEERRKRCARCRTLTWYAEPIVKPNGKRGWVCRGGCAQPVVDKIVRPGDVVTKAVPRGR